MPAWEISKIWSAAEISGYRDFVAREGPGRAGSHRCTCEDMALRLVIDFAAQEQLPVMFSNGAHSGGLTPETFASKTDFEDVVLTSTGASDLFNKKMVKMVAGATPGKAASLALSTKGDLIILYNGHHVQVVTSSTPTKVTIAQGNFRPEAERCGAVSRWWNDNNQNRPTDSCYIGAIVREQEYQFNSKMSDWEYLGGDSAVFQKNNGQLVIWDFDAWNNLVVQHKVQPGETLSAIAQKAYGDGNTWKRIYESNRTAIGNNPDRIRSGQTLYLWKSKR
jgi:hypothetical protein